MIPKDLYYTEDHEWVKVEEGIAIIGITDYAVKELGEIVFIEYPTINTEIGQGDEFGAVESVKTVSSLYAPIAGKVIEINKELENSPEMVNDSPYGDGWLVKVKAEDITKEIGELMSAREYTVYLNTL